MANQLRTTSEKPQSKTRAQILKEASRLEEDATISALKHYKASGFYGVMHYCLGGAIFLASLVAGSSAFVSIEFFRTYSDYVLLGVALASGFMTYMNASEKSSLHKAAGNEYSNLREDLRVFSTVESLEVRSDTLMTAKLRAFSDRKQRLNGTYPQPSQLYYWMAKFDIWLGQTTHKVDRDTK